MHEPKPALHTAVAQAKWLAMHMRRHVCTSQLRVSRDSRSVVSAAHAAISWHTPWHISGGGSAHTAVRCTPNARFGSSEAAANAWLQHVQQPAAVGYVGRAVNGLHAAPHTTPAPVDCAHITQYAQPCTALMGQLRVPFDNFALAHSAHLGELCYGALGCLDAGFEVEVLVPAIVKVPAVCGEVLVEGDYFLDGSSDTVGSQPIVRSRLSPCVSRVACASDMFAETAARGRGTVQSKPINSDSPIHPGQSPCLQLRSAQLSSRHEVALCCSAVGWAQGQRLAWAQLARHGTACWAMVCSVGHG
jgi:hypothetical protein